VFTDSHGLSYFKNNKRNNVAYRRLAKLEQFDYEIVYKKGVSNIADYTNRFPSDKEDTKEVCELTALDEPILKHPEGFWERKKIEEELLKDPKFADILITL
jgi:hypothetical protein